MRDGVAALGDRGWRTPIPYRHLEVRMSIELSYAFMSYLLLWGFSWWGAIAQRWGEAESAHAASSVWLYVRRVALTVTSLIGVMVVGGESVTRYGWGISLWLLPALVFGLLLGQRNRGGFVPDSVTALLVAAFHTFATELYFRGYLFHHMLGLIGWWAFLLSAVLYGLYYLTVHTVWISGPRGRVIAAVVFGLLGLTFAVAYQLTGSFFAAWLVHFGAVIRWGGKRGT